MTTQEKVLFMALLVTEIESTEADQAEALMDRTSVSRSAILFIGRI
jgi:hypothetical protein